MNWLTQLYTILGLGSWSSTSAPTVNEGLYGPAIEAVARHLNLVDDEASPLGPYSIRWDMRQIFEESFETLSTAYSYPHGKSWVPRLIKIDSTKNFLILSGNMLSKASIPISMRINDQHFVLRGGLRNLKPFVLERHEQLPFLNEIILDGKEENKAPIHLTKSDTFLLSKVIMAQEYYLPQATISSSNHTDPFYNFLFFERIIVSKSILPFRPFNVNARVFTHVGSPLCTMMHRDYSHREWYGEAGFQVVLFLKMLLAFDNELLKKNVQNNNLKQLLNDLQDAESPLNHHEGIIDIVARAYKTMFEASPTSNHSPENLLGLLLAMEPWLGDHILCREALTHPICSRQITLDDNGLGKLLLFKADRDSLATNKRVVLNGKHEFRLFAYIQTTTRPIYAVFLEENDDYNLISLEGSDAMMPSSLVIDSATSIQLGEGLYCYRYQPLA